MLSLDPGWAPAGPDFGLKALVAYALGQGTALH
jgi:hypothetical protein